MRQRARGHRPPRVRLAAIMLFAGLAAATPARADLLGVFDEVKFGVLAHDLGVRPSGSGGIERGVDLNGEILLVPLPLVDDDDPPWRRVLFAPRPHLGGSWNANGYTSKLYLGFTWSAEPFSDVIAEDDGFWAAFLLGAALHNGRVGREDGRSGLGARLLFNSGGEVGYRLGRFTVSVLFDHVSNAGLGVHNQGLNDLGGRIGWRF